jgi:Rod binding domain-containing protein
MFSSSSIGNQSSISSQMDNNRLTQLSNLSAPSKNKTNEEIKSLAHQFESIFVHQLLKSMRSTVQKSGLFDSHATQMYESLYDEEMAKLMTEKRSIGLADIVYKDLVRLEDIIIKVQPTSGTSDQESTQSIDLKG